MNEAISAFSADQVVRLTGLTTGQLAYWDKTGFFRPQYAADARRSPYSRIYSFKDVVALRTISVLKGKHGVSLPHLREVAEKLATYSKTPFADIKLKVWNRKVQFDEPETGKTRGVVDGQFVLLPIIEVMEDIRREAAAMKQRQSSEIGRLEKHRYIAHNALVIAGTRISVASILRFIEAGYTVPQIIKEYPKLTPSDIEAAVRHGKTGAAA